MERIDTTAAIILLERRLNVDETNYDGFYM